MASLHYQRWTEHFSIDKFSSEDSMRDYLFSNPRLIFDKDFWVIPITEEKCLPESSIGKTSGRADIILCRILEDKEKVKSTKELSLGSMELWIVELKKNEVSYENGFKQLFDYMIVVKGDKKIQEEIRDEVVKEVRKRLDMPRLTLKEGQDSALNIRGSLVAPSFGLIDRAKIESISKDVNKYQKYYDELKNILKAKGKSEEGFTLIDVVDAAKKFFNHIFLVKLIRFKRGDETIIYSENVLGGKSAAQVLRVDPVDLFQNNILKEGDTFYFRDNKGKDNKEIECRVLNKRGPSHSFKIKIVSINGHNSVRIPKWAKDHLKFNPQKLKIEGTAKTCSIALHDLYEIYNEDELFMYYECFGDKNFIRKDDKKSLSDLREEQRLR